MMNLQSSSGLAIAAGFVLYVAAMLVAPQLYQTEDIATRLAIIAAHQTRWNVSQFGFALGIGAPAVGFLLLAVSQRGVQAAWLYYLGAAAFMAGSVIGVWLVFRQTLEPAAFWEGAQIPALIAYGFLLLTLAGLLLIGLAMLQSGFPGWLGYLLVGAAAVLLIATLVLRGGGGFFISILIYLITAVAGIAIWRH